MQAGCDAHLQNFICFSLTWLESLTLPVIGVQPGLSVEKYSRPSPAHISRCASAIYYFIFTLQTDLLAHFWKQLFPSHLDAPSHGSHAEQTFIYICTGEMYSSA